MVENLKCLVFMNKTHDYKIIKFKNREVAQEYYKVANRKNNFMYVGLLDECIEWCKNRNFEYIIIERDEYNIHE